MDRIHQGERLAMIGFLTESKQPIVEDVHCVAYNAQGEVVKDYGSLDYGVEDGCYSCVVTTDDMLGRIKFRFEVYFASGDKLVGDRTIDIIINQ